MTIGNQLSYLLPDQGWMLPRQIRPRPLPGRKRSRRLGLEPLESRRLFAADSIGVTNLDTGEFLLGTVAVTPVFFESNGQIDPESQNWSAAEIDQMLTKVAEGVDWWSDMLDTFQSVHTLDFVIDETFALDPVETPYEPIDRTSSAIDLYISPFMASLGYDASSIEDSVRQFNQDQRIKYSTDWAFTIFVVDSSDDLNGQFASGGDFTSAFAYPGGLFVVTPSTRPASTISHEMGHIFWARDEYPGGGSWFDRRGYYNTQNLNAADNTTEGFEQQVSIMRGGVPLTEAFNTHSSPASTLAMVGWQDSDGDGIFDVADVPLDFDGLGYFDADNSTYHFSGQAAAMPLRNLNPSGPQSDITLGRISQLQYRLDDGPWMVAAEPDQPIADFDISLLIDEPFDHIQLRVIDLATGVVSPVIDGSSVLPAVSSSLAGVAFVDQNGDGQRDPSEPLLTSTTVTVRHADGSLLVFGGVDANDFPDGVITPAQLSGVELESDGFVTERGVGSYVAAELSDRRVFHAFDRQSEQWTTRWSEENVFVATFDEPIGDVRIDAIGVDSLSYGRIVAFDASGRMLTRTTSEAMAGGETRTLRVTDPLGRIARIEVLGHAGSAVALDNLQFGSESIIQTDASGSWRLTNLPEGEYHVEMVPEQVIYAFADPIASVTVSGGSSDLVVAAATRVDSPRHNSLLPADSNGDGEVTSLDALVIINDLSRNEARMLQWSETEGFKVDVNNDGAVTALDALWVINRLAAASDGPEPEQGEPQQSDSDPVQSATPVPSHVADQVFAAWGQSEDAGPSQNDFADSNTADESIGSATPDGPAVPPALPSSARSQDFAASDGASGPESLSSDEEGSLDLHKSAGLSFRIISKIVEPLR